MVCASPVVVDQGSLCTVTVTDSAGVGTSTVPAGSIAFSSARDGAFSSPSCSLSGGTCSVTYTPTTVDGGSHTISATYTASDDIHATSSDSAGSAILVSARATTTLVICQTPIVVDETSICSVTVTDTDAAGSASDPAGTVTFVSNKDGAFAPSATCTLSGNLDGSSGCSVTYTANTVDGGLHTITGGYTPTDDVHAASTDSAGVVVVVNSRSTSTAVSCASPVVVGQAAELHHHRDRHRERGPRQRSGGYGQREHRRGRHLRQRELHPGRQRRRQQRLRRDLHPDHP